MELNAKARLLAARFDLDAEIKKLGFKEDTKASGSRQDYTILAYKPKGKTPGFETHTIWQGSKATYSVKGLGIDDKKFAKPEDLFAEIRKALT